MKQILIAWMFCCIFCMWAFVPALAAMPAGQRVIKGIVTDAQTKESLIGASVTVKDLHTGSITGLDGSYRIGGLLSGRTVLVCSYIGYEPQEKEVNWDGSGELEVNFSLVPSTFAVKEVVVSARMNRETEGSARLTEKVSPNVLNIVSVRAIQASPDLTVANVLQRVSGVSVEKDGQGEGKYPVVRGMDKRYNYTLINGLKVSSPDDKNRYIPMDIFPADLLDNEPQVFTDIYDAVFSFHPVSEGRGCIANPNTYISREDILA